MATSSASASLARTSSRLSLNTEVLGSGPYSRMATRYRKRFLMFGLEVLDISVRFGPETTEGLKHAARSGGTEARRFERLSAIALDSDNALLEIRFLRPVELALLLRELKRNSREVYEAGLIDLELYQEIAGSLPSWYSFLNGRGVRERDRMLYRIEGESFRVVYIASDGRVLFDERYSGPQRRLSILGAYFRRDSEFRLPLLRSLPK